MSQYQTKHGININNVAAYFQSVFTTTLWLDDFGDVATVLPRQLHRKPIFIDNIQKFLK